MKKFILKCLDDMRLLWGFSAFSLMTLLTALLSPAMLVTLMVVFHLISFTILEALLAVHILKMWRKGEGVPRHLLFSKNAGTFHNLLTKEKVDESAKPREQQG